MEKEQALQDEESDMDKNNSGEKIRQYFIY